MPVATMPAVERIARVLAGERFSANAEGDERSAVESVELAWPDFQGEAVAVLKALREPDEAMVAVGDVDVWRRMVAAALGDDDPVTTGRSADEPLQVGDDPFIEGP